MFLSIFITPNNQCQKENLFSSNTFTILKLNFSKENISVVINAEENWFKNLLERKNWELHAHFYSKYDLLGYTTLQIISNFWCIF